MTAQLGAWLLLLCPLADANKSDWPRWRGPTSDGVWHISNVPETWPANGPKVKWKVDVGDGYGGVAVANGRVYLMDRPKPSDKSKQPDGEERILCFDARTGELLWQHRYPAHYGDMEYGNGPRGTPTIVDGLVYTLGAVGRACCLDAVSGKAVWEKDMVAEHQARIPTWGFAASPVIVDNLVILHTGAEPDGCFMAFDRKSGREVWRNVSDPAGYCTPILIDSPSGPQLVAWTPENIHGMNPHTGEHYWKVPYKVTYGVSIASPIYHRGIVFVTGYWEGSKAIQLGNSPSDAKVVWEENKFLRGLMSSPLYRDGLVYMIDKRFGLTCLEIATGTKLWDADNKLTPRDRNPQSVMVWLGDSDRVIAFNAKGELVLARFTPEGFVEQSRAQVIEPQPVTWANPAFANDCVYLHNGKQLLCVQVKE